MENMEVYENEIISSEPERYTDLLHVTPTDVYEQCRTGENTATFSNRRKYTISSHQTTKSKAGARYTRSFLIFLMVVTGISLVSSVISIAMNSLYMNQFREKIQSLSSVVGLTNNKTDNVIAVLNEKHTYLDTILKDIKGDAQQLPNKTGLYDFSSHTFTTCGNKGYQGPSLELCRNAYRGIYWGKFLTVQDLGIQQWEVPETAYYIITAAGAKGGSGNNGNYSGGRGATLKGTFYLKQMTLLNLVCGQRGSDGRPSEPGGGGGGTFVYEGGIGGNGLLLAAAGGGGGGEENTTYGYNGINTASSYNYKGYNIDNTLGNGGFGYGGRGGNYTTAGAGWRSDGSNTTVSDCGNPGRRWLGGHKISSADGGFGGGGSGCFSNGGGGGGGFTGGAGTSNSTRRFWGGGGAGSYNNGTEKVSSSGSNNGDGYIRIEKTIG